MHPSKTKGELMHSSFSSKLHCVRRTLNEHLDNAQYCPATFRKELHDIT